MNCGLELSFLSTCQCPDTYLDLELDLELELGLGSSHDPSKNPHKSNMVTEEVRLSITSVINRESGIFIVDP
ncbi:hypothetical protein SAMN05216299_12420 [Nitrosospira sp. Nsp14]|nr:hypothetical protein SAMN05216299_12420 [Nitrosospira sp. Nsp14]